MAGNEYKIGNIRNAIFNPSWLIYYYVVSTLRTPYVVMQRTAMGEHQKSSILSNELVRRLSNINIGRVDHSEVLEIIEKFIKQLKNSGYGNKQSRDLVVGGIKG